jgi:hypothetical protein
MQTIDLQHVLAFLLATQYILMCACGCAWFAHQHAQFAFWHAQFAFQRAHQLAQFAPWWNWWG